jgi:hypothetical protein
MESRIKPNGEAEIIWDFFNTSTEQLTRLEELSRTDQQTAAEFSRELIENGFLSYRIGGKSYTGFNPKAV